MRVFSVPVGTSATQSSRALPTCGPPRQKAILRPSCDAAGCSPPMAMTGDANATSLRTEMWPAPCSSSPYRLGSAVGAVVIVAVGVLVTAAVGGAGGGDGSAAVGPGGGLALTPHETSSASATNGATTRDGTRTEEA